MTLATMKSNDIIKQAQIIASENAAAGTLAALSKAYGDFAGSALSMASGLTISTMDIAAKTGALG